MFIFNRNSIIAINVAAVILFAILLLDIFKLNNLWIFIPMCVAFSIFFIYFLIKIRFLQTVTGIENSIFRTLIRYACLIIFFGTSYMSIYMNYYTLYALDVLVVILFLFTVQAFLNGFGDR